MSPFFYLFLAYAMIWLALGLYLFLMNRKIARVEGDLRELRRRLEREEG
jgi:CcmD family protein